MSASVRDSGYPCWRQISGRIGVYEEQSEEACLIRRAEGASSLGGRMAGSKVLFFSGFIASIVGSLK
jgi:hypothetical protein